MSVADERRASGKAMVDARRTSGKSMTDDRSASGKAMAADRRQSGKGMASERRASGKAFRDDLRALAVSDSDARVLPPAAERAPIPAARGIANYTASPVASSAGGGIAGPLVETDFSSRQYYARGTRSSDGLFFIPALKEIQLTDANGEIVTIKLAEEADEL